MRNINVINVGVSGGGFRLLKRKGWTKMIEFTCEEELEYMKGVAHERYRWAWELTQENIELKQKLSHLQEESERK